MATPLALSSSSSSDDMNIDDYFDFDAASCDPTAATGWEMAETTKRLSVVNFDQSILDSRLLIHRDTFDDKTYQLQTETAGVYPDFYDDDAILEPATDYAYREAYYYSSDSESDPSAPGSPSGSLSPPSSPISSGADDDDADFLSDEGDHNDRPRLASPAPFVGAPTNELASATTALLECSVPPSPVIVHAPRPSSGRTDLVESLENIVQPTRDSPEPENFKFEMQEPELDDGGDNIWEHQTIAIDDSPPSRSPSCDNSGPTHGHTVGKSKPRRSRKRAVCTYPDCGQTFTRGPDLPRHWKLKHERPNLLEVFRDRGKNRKWCMGCVTVLSRADSRRRHELSCPHMLEYRQYGVRSAVFAPLPDIYAESREEFRLWCSCCHATFATPDERCAHEGGCVQPEMGPLYTELT
ncbi:hypothetical protein C8R46DRAFT_1289881 [Mycena filopes]|nr:hypothetical protein C8R46DRAFT_1289881 [Mycena filopes]